MSGNSSMTFVQESRTTVINVHVKSCPSSTLVRSPSNRDSILRVCVCGRVKRAVWCVMCNACVLSPVRLPRMLVYVHMCVRMYALSLNICEVTLHSSAVHGNTFILSSHFIMCLFEWLQCVRYHRYCMPHSSAVCVGFNVFFISFILSFSMVFCTARLCESEGCLRLHLLPFSPFAYVSFFFDIPAMSVSSNQ